MRIFLITFLILIFNLQTWTNADDIKDFEIEGMSIGDSLLNYYSTNEISEMRTVIFNDYEKRVININNGVYENVVVSYKKNDPEYIIKGLTGNLGFYSGINECYLTMDRIQNEIRSLFSKLIKKDWGILKLDEPNQTYKPVTYDFKNNDRIQISCWDFRISKKEDNKRDLLKFSLYSSEYRDATSTEAIKN